MSGMRTFGIAVCFGLMVLTSLATIVTAVTGQRLGTAAGIVSTTFFAWMFMWTLLDALSGWFGQSPGLKQEKNADE